MILEDTHPKLIPCGPFRLRSWSTQLVKEDLTCGERVVPNTCFNVSLGTMVAL